MKGPTGLYFHLVSASVNTYWKNCSQPYLAQTRSTVPSPVAPRLLFLRYFEALLLLKYPFFLLLPTVFTLLVESTFSYRLTRRFVETQHFIFPGTKYPRTPDCRDPRLELWIMGCFEPMRIYPGDLDTLPCAVDSAIPHHSDTAPHYQNAK